MGRPDRTVGRDMEERLMARAQAKIVKTTNPVGWFYTFDRIDTQDGAMDNMATAANPNAALDAIKPLIAALPGSLSNVTIIVETFEP